MKIKLLAVGKTNVAYVVDAVNVYEGRLKHYIPFEIKYIPDVKNVKNLSHDELKEKEGGLILSNIAANDDIILLDEAGKLFSSVQFSEYLEKKMQSPSKTLVFVIGGAYGFSPEVYSRANAKLSLSPMTFTHQMIRMLFVEQLYRAFSIIRGESYHHI